MQISPHNTITIQGTTALPSQGQSIRSGDVIEFSVVETVQASPAWFTRPDSSAGIINYKGQPIEAKLPPNLTVGDIVQAEVIIENENIQLKIINIQKQAQRQDSTEFLFKIEAELNSFLQDKLGNGLALARGIHISPNILEQLQYNSLEALLSDTNIELSDMLTVRLAQNASAGNVLEKDGTAASGQLYSVPDSLLAGKEAGAIDIENLAKYIEQASFKENHTALEQVRNTLLQYQSKLQLDGNAETTSAFALLSAIVRSAKADLSGQPIIFESVIKETAGNIITLLREFSAIDEKVKTFITDSLQTLPLKIQHEIFSGILEKIVPNNSPELNPAITHQVNSLTALFKDSFISNLSGLPTDKIYGFLEQINRELTKDAAAQNTAQPLSRHIELIRNKLDTVGESESEKAQFLQNVALLRNEKAENVGSTLLQLQQLITQVDKLISTHSVTTSLSSVLQSLGEPVLVLFPFLMQGVLTQANIFVDQDASNQSNCEQKDSTGRLPFKKIRTTVTLPNLGLVDVNIAYRDKEMLLQLTAEDAEVLEFLESQTPILTCILETNGYEDIRIKTVCEKPNILPTTAQVSLGQSKLMV